MKNNQFLYFSSSNHFFILSLIIAHQMAKKNNPTNVNHALRHNFMVRMTLPKSKTFPWANFFLLIVRPVLLLFFRCSGNNFRKIFLFLAIVDKMEKVTNAFIIGKRLIEHREVAYSMWCVMHDNRIVRGKWTSFVNLPFFALISLATLNIIRCASQILLRNNRKCQKLRQIMTVQLHQFISALCLFWHMYAFSICSKLFRVQ